ncbi:hypothetical protein ScalyP_jg10390 [Parmales sp. scaly parma]|nr:hypothetical protein ScalyP_jg10390 [Parmales sp. scaly parma]|tara:strand:+ start:616 stop:891 length:276 start_codon:yes stop_codon:yes gene_type:complete
MGGAASIPADTELAVFESLKAAYEANKASETPLDDASLFSQLSDIYNAAQPSTDAPTVEDPPAGLEEEEEVTPAPVAAVVEEAAPAPAATE